MRALSHAVRLALIEVLAVHGALTATQAGELIGESATTCSFHLRQLAKYGFVEEAGRGPGRSRPWRVTHLGWTVEDLANDTEVNAAAKALGEIALQRQLQRHHEFNRRRREYPVEWRDVGDESQTVWWVTPSEMASLQQEIDSLVYRFRDRLANPELRPADASPVEVMVLSHLFLPPDISAQSHEQDRDSL
ncbi:helix-turn-helix domain-containing protein [Streptomyces griseochromogenes]|uniref:helix-turn-helix domain-containing protein n=1 Tax=Streptomyces griseochromogenes TaxID=68214 RepID=UPI00378E89AF